MKYILSILFLIVLKSCNNATEEQRDKNFSNEEVLVTRVPNKENVWVFVMAGQSNMAGRAFVEPQDTIQNNRILTINKEGALCYAKEPIHFYEPTMKGLDIGMSFATELLKKTPNSISILLIPTAVGGSSIEKWLGDETHRGVTLFTNFEEKVAFGKKYGTIKGILWHQGESDTENSLNIEEYDKNLGLLFSRFRKTTDTAELPILIGELGAYSTNTDNWDKLNSKMASYAKTDSLTKVVSSSNLTDRGDQLHFDTRSIRILGKRFAERYLE